VPGWSFDAFTLDPSAHRLSANEAAIHLSTKAFALLVALIERRPAVVPTAQLHALLWPATHVADVNLAVLVSEARHALGDDGRRQRYVRTVHRVGYQWNAEVEVAPSPTGRPAGVRDGTSDPGWRLVLWGTRELALGDGTYLLGRDATCTVALDSVAASRRHAQLELAGDRATLTDLDSKNGTLVDNARLSGTATLASGAEIRIGNLVITLVRVAASGMQPTLSVVGGIVPP
jgi:DNA-binding winged helix-turn-helix (wHTH) protein